MSPHLTDRPLALLRCPEGVEGPRFFQKNPWKGIAPAIKVIKNPGIGGAKLLAIDSFDGVMALVQSAALELHPWSCRIQDLDRTDMLTFDLDPGDGVGWRGLAAAAREVRDRLAGLGLRSFAKTTGGKGLHVVAPLKPTAPWEAAKEFARALAASMEADAPKAYVARAAKTLRAGRIFVDYLRNGRGATAICPYSTRARAGAPVALPIAWEELGTDRRGAHFNVKNASARLARRGADPWAEFFRVKQALPR
jgi:bifunctional non-homologous end joining protein LigD